MAASRVRGATLLEFAIVITVLLLMIFGIIDFARAIYAYHFVANAAREASRYASVRGSTWSAECPTATQPTQAGCYVLNSDVQSYVANLANGLGISNSQSALTAVLNPQNSPNQTNCGASTAPATVPISPGCVAQVNVYYGFTFILPFMPSTPCSLATPNGLGIGGELCMSSTSEMVVSQ